ncbi:MAG TPA: hypothetical protein DCX52_15070 [Massilia sp.]|nr:hypothetical protein [Massilia sp.]
MFDPGRRILLAALSCVAVPVGATDAKLFAKFDTCRMPEYPEGAEGVSLIGFLVGGDGMVVDIVVLNSSGSRDADRAAALALSRCAFQRPASVDKSVNFWVSITYVWQPNDDPDMLRASRSAAIAAGRGNVSARYHLSLLLFSMAKTDADREKAFMVLRSAAELGAQACSV